MTKRPSVLLIDDPRLGGVQDVLEEIGAHVTTRRTRTLGAQPHAYELVVTTAHTALALGEVFAETARWLRPVWVAFHNQDFLPLRERLRRIGVDFLVHPNANREVLRLLLLRTLYTGTEKRETQRLPVGSEVSCETANDTFAATLLDIGPGGFRLSCGRDLEPGTRLTLVLPPSLSGGAAHRLIGCALREDVSAETDLTERAFAFRFEPVSRPEGPTLHALQEGRAIGSAVTRLGRDESASDLASDPLDEIAAPAKERRELPRGSYLREIRALTTDAADVLLARDLSVEGVRIGPCPDLATGARVEIAIPGAPREEALAIQSVVARDDRENGLYLRFGPLPPNDRKRLERIIAALPPLEWLGDEADGADPRVVVRALRRSST